jgi:hypothetical protein
VLARCPPLQTRGSAFCETTFQRAVCWVLRCTTPQPLGGLCLCQMRVPSRKHYAQHLVSSDYLTETVPSAIRPSHFVSNVEASPPLSAPCSPTRPRMEQNWKCKAGEANALPIPPHHSFPERKVVCTGHSLILPANLRCRSGPLNTVSQSSALTVLSCEGEESPRTAGPCPRAPRDKDTGSHFPGMLAHLAESPDIKCVPQRDRNGSLDNETRMRARGSTTSSGSQCVMKQ